MVIRKGAFYKKFLAEEFYQDQITELEEKYQDLIKLGDAQTAGIGFILSDSPANA